MQLFTPFSFPGGIICMWHGNIADIPGGWVLCDGSEGTPDLRSKFVRGAPAATEPGTTGGSDTHTLSVSQMPSHRHSVPLGYSGGGGSTSYDSGSSSPVNSSYVGGGAAHNNLPAYYEILYIMKE